VLFTLGAYLLSDDVPVTTSVSIPAIVLWSGLTLLAGGLWLHRRRR
jgi:LPXTG-motif cell wall-anchored protein